MTHMSSAVRLFPSGAKLEEYQGEKNREKP
jgi:hypothetical protein